MTPSCFNLTANYILGVLHIICLKCHSLNNTSHSSPPCILFSYCSHLCFSVGMTCKLPLFCFSSLRRCYITWKQLYRSLPLYDVLCVRVQVAVSRAKPQRLGCTSISPEILAAVAVCHSLHLHPQQLNRFGPLKTVVAFYCLPPRISDLIKPD